MNILNYTPHVINVISLEGKEISYPSLGIIRCDSIPAKVILFYNIPFEVGTAPEFNGVYGLPDYKENDVLVVSMVVGDYLKNYPEDWKGIVLVPDTGPNGAIRDKEGKIVAVKRMNLYKGLNE